MSNFPTAAEAIIQIGQWSDLPSRKRVNLQAPLRLLARVYQRPLEAIPLNPAELAKIFLNASPAALGIKPSSLTSYQSSMRAVLRRLNLIDRRRQCSDTIAPEWAALLGLLPDLFISMRLQGFIAYCSDCGVSPPNVTEATLSDYLEILRSRRMGGEPSSQIRQVVRSWARAQSISSAWPAQILRGPNLNKRYTLPFSAYPKSFQDEVSEFKSRMEKNSNRSLFLNGIFSHKKSVDTVRLRMNGIRYAAAALVYNGTLPQNITSLSVLVEAQNAKTIIDWHWCRANQKVTDHLATISCSLQIVGRDVVGLTGEALCELTEITRHGKPKKRSRMTAKREQRLQTLDDPDREAMLLHLPRRIMAEAQKLMDLGKKLNGAWLAAVAVSVGIELRCPIRIKNLSALAIGHNLIKLDSRSRTWTHIVIEPKDVKNDVPLNWPVSNELSKLIDFYLQEFRIHMNNSDTAFLFPNRDHANRPRTAASLGGAISTAIHQYVGIDLTPHDFRAIAGWLILREDPNAVNDLRLILGHKTLATTLAYYTSFQPKQAAQRYNLLLDRSIANTKVRADIVFAKALSSKRKSPRSTKAAA